MVYPIVIVLVMLGVIFLLSYFVLPNLTEMISDNGAELPWITKVVMGMADFIRGVGGVILLLAIVGIAVLIGRIARTKKGKEFFDQLSLRVPGLSGMLKMLYVNRFADNLSTLIAGGIPITQALEITSLIVGNSVYQQAIMKTCEGVRKGQTMSAVLSMYPELFPAMFTQMVLVGEQTGSLDKSLLVMVSFYEKETDRAIDSMLVLIEPIMIVALGVVVGGVVAAVMIPLYSSMNTI